MYVIDTVKNLGKVTEYSFTCILLFKASSISYVALLVDKFFLKPNCSLV
jgi:hypothetical protein